MATAAAATATATAVAAVVVVVAAAQHGSGAYFAPGSSAALTASDAARRRLCGLSGFEPR